MEEDNFPRGHSSKKVTSSEKRITSKKKHDKDVLFQDEGHPPAKKQKLKKKEQKKPLKQVREENEGIGSFVDGLQTKVESTPKYKKLSQKTISVDMLLMGVVKEVHDYEIVVSLPNTMTGYVQITDVSSTYTKLLEGLQDNPLEAMEDKEEINSLQNFYAMGSPVICKVKSVELSGTGRQRIKLSFDPQAIHSHLTPSMLRRGMVIDGNVASIEDHGYVVDVGISGVNSFLARTDVETFIRDHNNGQALLIAQPMTCLIKDVKANGRSLVLSASPSAVAKATAKTTSQDNFATLLPGTKVKATVKNIYKDHIEMSVPSSYTGSLKQLHFEDNCQLPSEFKEKQVVNACIIFNCPESKSLGLSLVPEHAQSSGQNIRLPFEGLNSGDIIDNAEVLWTDKHTIFLQLSEQDRGIVYASHISDKKEKNATSMYEIGSKVRCRILDFNLMDRIATVSMKHSVLQQQFLGYHDIQPGALVEGTLTAIVQKGLCIKISSHVSGFVPSIHMADVIIHKPESKFKVGELLQLRVLYVDAKKRRLLLTHKNSLVQSTHPTITSYDQPKKDMILRGFIIAIKDFGYLVRFYNDITGLIPRAELSFGQEPIPDDSYYVGQVVKCRVTKIFPPEAKRITLSLRLSGADDRQVKNMDYKNQNIGQLTNVTVQKVRALGLDVTIHPDGSQAFLPKMHLSDFVENCDLMLACYEQGDTITDVMHWSFSPTRNCAVLTHKPLLIAAREKKELVQGFDAVQSGVLVMGVVKRVVPYGVFVELPNNVVGLAPKAAMSDDFITSSSAFHVGQTLRAKVTEVDPNKSRFLLSLKSSICLPKKGEGQQLMKQYFHERDLIMERLAVKEGWKGLLETNIGCQVMVKVLERVPEVGGLLCVLPNQLSGYVADSLIGGQSVVEKSKIKACVLHVDLTKKMIELCVDPKLINQIDADSKKKMLSKKSKSLENGEAQLVLIKENFLLVCMKTNGKLVYVPGKRHLNDVRTEYDQLTVGQTVKVIKQRIVNNQVFGEQQVTKKKELRPSDKAEPTINKPDPEAKKKTAKDLIESHNLHIGQKVTAIVKSVLEMQLNVRVKNAVFGRVHVTEATDKMMQNKFPLDKFQEGMKVEATIIGHREVKDHRYLPITHTNFTKLALELTLKQSKLNDDNYMNKDETVEQQLQSYKVGQTINCVVQKYVDSVLWVAVTSLLQGKVYQLNLSKNINVLEHPTNYFLQGSVRRGKIIKIDHQHQLLELTLLNIGCGKSDLAPAMVTNGRILKVLSSIGLVVQLPNEYRGRVSLTDLKDNFVQDPLKGYKEKQFVRCCVLEVASKDNVVLSTRASAVNKHHDPVIDPNIESLENLAVGDVVKGYVKNFTKVGVFVSLSRKLQGRIQLKKLSKWYIKEPEPLFPKGKLLTVKVLSIDESGKIELSSSSADTGAADPVPKKVPTPRDSSGVKRKISNTQDDALDEETCSSLGEEKSSEDVPKARLQVSSSFHWESSDDTISRAVLLDHSVEDSDEDEQSSQDEPPLKKTKKEKQAEEDLLYKMEHQFVEPESPPETNDDFDRLVMSSPNSSLVWVRYMAYHLHSAEIDQARAVAERALKTINFREEQEKLNVWVALLNLENLYGTEESLLKVFKEALKNCEHLKVFQNMINIYTHTGKLQQADQLYNSMLKRFNLTKEVWISYGFFLMQNGRQEAAHKLMQRSFKSLAPKEHIDVIVKFAQMEFRFGEAERGKTMFDNILINYPKRTDIWSVYLDMMMKLGDVEAIRHLFERVINLSLSPKKIKFFFKRYLEFEKKYGNEEDVDEVKRKAVEYVESKMATE